MVIQNYSDIDGNLQNIPVVGTIGGVIMQIAMIVTTIKNEYGEEEHIKDIFEDKRI